MKLYYDPITVNCRKVVAGLDLMGVDYDEEKLNYFAGDHKQPSYTKINPNAMARPRHGELCGCNLLPSAAITL